MSKYNPLETGIRVAKARKDAGLTQEIMAEQLGITLDHYARLERGKKYWTVEILADIAEILGLSLDHLIFGKAEIPVGLAEKLRNSLNEFLEGT